MFFCHIHFSYMIYAHSIKACKTSDLLLLYLWPQHESMQNERSPSVIWSMPTAWKHAKRAISFWYIITTAWKHAKRAIFFCYIHDHSKKACKTSDPLLLNDLCIKACKMSDLLLLYDPCPQHESMQNEQSPFDILLPQHEGMQNKRSPSVTSKTTSWKMSYLLLLYL